MLEQHIVTDNINAHIKLFTLMKTNEMLETLADVMSNFAEKQEIVTKTVTRIGKVFDSKGELEKVRLYFDKDNSDDKWETSLANIKAQLCLVGANLDTLKGKEIEIATYTDMIGEDIWIASKDDYMMWSNEKPVQYIISVK